MKEVFHIAYIEFDAALIISIKSSLLRLAPPTKAPFTFDIENISFIGDGKPFDYLFYDEDDNEYDPYLRSTYDEKYFEDEESAKTYYDSLVKKYIKD